MRSNTIPACLPRANRLLMDLLPIPGPSGKEREVIQYLMESLRSAGVADQAMYIDDAHKSSRLGGEIGNLIVDLPGNPRHSRRLFMAHCDTVPLCVGSRPVRRGRFIESADPATGLGADNRTGIAVLLNLVHDLMSLDGDHPPTTLLFTVQEEVGMQGVRHVNLEHLLRPKLAFNFDGGRASKLTVGATGCYRLTMEFRGKAAHAALRPQEGISAISAAAIAVHSLYRDGLIGRVDCGASAVTTNIGTIQGGSAVNVVPDRVVVQAEVRGHDSSSRKRILDNIIHNVECAARTVRDASGNSASVTIASRLDYENFRLETTDPSVLAAESAVAAAGLAPVQAVTDGGIDANWMFAHGLPVVSLGAGQVDGHTRHEKVNLDEFDAACCISFQLATADYPSDGVEVWGCPQEFVHV